MIRIGQQMVAASWLATVASERKVSVDGLANRCQGSTLCAQEPAPMRKLIFIGIVAIGALGGLLSAADDDWPTRMVMVAVGALFGTAIGGAVTRVGHSKKSLRWRHDPIPGMGVTSEDLAANFWRDRGHPPFMKPPESDSDPGIPR